MRPPAPASSAPCSAAAQAAVPSSTAGGTAVVATDEVATDPVVAHARGAPAAGAGLVLVAGGQPPDATDGSHLVARHGARVERGHRGIEGGVGDQLEVDRAGDGEELDADGHGRAS